MLSPAIVLNKLTLKGFFFSKLYKPLTGFNARKIPVAQDEGKGGNFPQFSLPPFLYFLHKQQQDLLKIL